MPSSPDMDVSKNRGTPKLVYFMENPIKIRMTWGENPYFWKHPYMGSWSCCCINETLYVRSRQRLARYNLHSINPELTHPNMKRSYMIHMSWTSVPRRQRKCLQWRKPHMAMARISFRVPNPSLIRCNRLCHEVVTLHAWKQECFIIQLMWIQPIWGQICFTRIINLGTIVQGRWCVFLGCHLLNKI